MQLYWTFFIEGALCSSFPLQPGSTAFRLCSTGIYLSCLSPDNTGRTLSSSLRSSQLSSAVTTHPWILPEL